MGQLEDGVRLLIKEKYRYVAAFGRAIGMPKQTLYSVLAGDLTTASLATVAPIAKGLDLDLQDIAEGRLVAPRERTRTVLVPLFGSISAGTPIEPTLADDTFPLPAELHYRYPNSFVLRIEGNSMNRIMPHGFYALVEPCESANISGQLYALTVGDGNATVKRVILHDNGITLEPDSYDPTYKPLLLDYSDPDAKPVAIIGKIVWHCPPPDWHYSRM